MFFIVILEQLVESKEMSKIIEIKGDVSTFLSLMVSCVSLYEK